VAGSRQRPDVVTHRGLPPHRRPPGRHRSASACPVGTAAATEIPPSPGWTL